MYQLTHFKPLKQAEHIKFPHFSQQCFFLHWKVLYKDLNILKKMSLYHLQEAWLFGKTQFSTVFQPEFTH